jgi:hypothetical protein
MNDTYNVTYTAYGPGSGEVISEGVMPIQTTSAYMTEQALKAIFNGSEVIIRYTNRVS